MAYWHEPVYENGFEVRYSNNCELYHLDPKTGEYDAKIDVYPNHIETYTSENSYWDKHDHHHTDEHGNTTEAHPMESRSWRDTCRS